MKTLLLPVPRFQHHISVQPHQRPTTDLHGGKRLTPPQISSSLSAATMARQARVFILVCSPLSARYTNRGRIILHRIGRPGEYDDEQAWIREEANALEDMDDLQRAEYLRAKGMHRPSFSSASASPVTHVPVIAFIEANPPETLPTDISLSQFLAIQEKGVSAWEFEPELEIANCFVEGRTEIEFFDSECSVQSNLPIPKQNEVYYWEAKIYDKPDSSLISIGVSTKPYPLFRLPGMSIWYM